ncbi:MAG: hypothetical protein BGO43_01665 [Gammaproteobacteria bacterium 39-13]|nr:MAG: hypothetical protein BGO43_01665 [Gammaproteobacteria bacterium 39-13]
MICAVLYIFDKILLWLEEKGLLYYRKRKSDRSGLIGNTLLELQNIFNPSTQNVIEMKQNSEVKQCKNNTDKDEN